MVLFHPLYGQCSCITSGRRAGFFQRAVVFSNGDGVTVVLVGGCNLMLPWSFAFSCVMKTRVSVRMKRMCLVHRFLCRFLRHHKSKFGVDEHVGTFGGSWLARNF